MLNFSMWLGEAEGIPTSCADFNNTDKPSFWGVGSDLGCHLKKRKIRRKKNSIKEALLGNPGSPFAYYPSSLNVGCGGYVGKCPPPPTPINNKTPNEGCGGSSGKCPTIVIATNNAGCGGYVGKCPPVVRGCSGSPGPCPDQVARSGATTNQKTEAPPKK